MGPHHLILAVDGVHNFLEGLTIGSVFLTEFRMGVLAWLAAAMHETHQELGDFGVLVHGDLTR
jgi:zinc and cadmium transporter